MFFEMPGLAERVLTFTLGINRELSSHKQGSLSRRHPFLEFPKPVPDDVDLVCLCLDV